MAVDFEALRNLERRRYVLDHAPTILCALIARRYSTDPVTLIDQAIETASELFDRVEPQNPQSSRGFSTPQWNCLTGTHDSL